MGKMWSRWSIWMAAVVVLLSGCAAETTEVEVPELMGAATMSEKEKTIPVGRMDLYAGNLLAAEVVPQTEQLYFAMDGTVLSIEVVAGQKVEEGDVLAVVSQESLLESIAALQQKIDAAETTYELEQEQAELDVQIAEKKLAMLKQQYKEQQEAEKKALEEKAAAEKAAEESSAADGEETEETKEIEETEETEKTEDTAVTPLQVQQITQFDLQLASLSLQGAELNYRQLQEEYELEQEQLQAELQSLEAQLGEDTLKAPYAGRISEVYYAAGSYVTREDAVMLLVNENQKMLRGEAYYNTALKSVSTLDAVINGTVYEITYIPYDDLEYAKRVENETLPTWFSFKESNDLNFGEAGTVRAYDEVSIDALVIPTDCVQSDEEGKYVYKAENGKRVRTYITVGIVTQNYTEILEGLAEGDEVYGIE